MSKEDSVRLRDLERVEAWMEKSSQKLSNVEKTLAGFLALGTIHLLIVSFLLNEVFELKEKYGQLVKKEHIIYGPAITSSPRRN